MMTTRNKLAYATGGVALNLANLVVSQWLLKLYVPSLDGALVSPTLFAAIFFIGRVVDGVTEPIAGFVSDRFRSRRGRRIPFITAMIIPVSLITFLLWIPPHPGQNHWLNAVWVFTLIQLFFICWSMLANPYMSLLPELSGDIKERMDISTWQGLFLMIGTLIFGAMGAVKEGLGWIGIGAVTGGVALISFLPTLLTVHEKSSIGTGASDEKMGPMLIFRWTRATFSNRAFPFLLGATALMWFGLNSIILVIPFWTQYALGRGDAEVVLIMAPFLASNIVFFFVMNALAKRFGKFAMFIVTLGSAAIAMPLLGLLGWSAATGTGSMSLSMVAMALIGIPGAGVMILPPALLADVIDHDEALTGKRREGIYFGVQAIFQKLAIGLSIGAATALMYIGSASTPSPRGLQYITFAAGAAMAVGCIVFLRYPIRDLGGKATFVSRSKP